LIKNIIFDFDGVICESVDIKTGAFYEMYLPYGEMIAQKVKEHHIQNGGMSRYDKFEYLEKNHHKIKESLKKNVPQLISLSQKTTKILIEKFNEKKRS